MKTTQRLVALWFILSSPPSLQAQKLVGSWQGTLVLSQNAVMTFPATITFRLNSAQLTGTLVMQAQGVAETYTLQGTTQNDQAAGTATYPKDGAVFQFEALLTNEQLAFGVGLNNAPIMAGTFKRAGQASVPNQLKNALPPNTATDGLARNARLVGVWATTSTYQSGADFYGSTRSTLVFFADGRLGSGGSSANASYSGNAGSSSGNSSGGGVTVAEGVRWYTKGDQIWLHATQQKVPDELYGRFSMAENGENMLLYRGNGKKLYERVN
ncbi:hypothetical protein J2I47_16505 [Fibrella sp. HMF5335]|uniref:Lipocalin-like domain-containing protein n=1 Tax=Fibrella rubiginis TaxID=2817060 RepID=A0A939K718_9BACT|nr:hypothetical protein [Fibrella rubiginis]MBO0938155.1 hypothetical protein [Fibrella rubiginis]